MPPMINLQSLVENTSDARALSKIGETDEPTSQDKAIIDWSPAAPMDGVGFPTVARP